MFKRATLVMLFVTATTALVPCMIQPASAQVPINGTNMQSGTNGTGNMCRRHRHHRRHRRTRRTF